MNRGGLKISGDIICQLAIYSYIIFHEVANLSCRSLFCNIFMLISEMYDFDIKHHHGMILSNTMYKNYCNTYSPRSSVGGDFNMIFSCIKILSLISFVEFNTHYSPFHQAQPCLSTFAGITVKLFQILEHATYHLWEDWCCASSRYTI